MNELVSNRYYSRLSFLRHHLFEFGLLCGRRGLRVGVGAGKLDDAAQSLQLPLGSHLIALLFRRVIHELKDDQIFEDYAALSE